MMTFKNTIKYIALLTLIASVLSACNAFSSAKEMGQNLSSSETVFETILPEALGEADEVFLEILDEVTGVALNPTRYPMQKKDDRSVFARIPVVNGSFVKYRYVLRSGSDVIEYNASSHPVLYRAYLASRPSIVKDVVQSWSNQKVTDSRGKISGYVFDRKTDKPIPDMIISINGNTTLSGTDGYYELNNLPVGEFMISAFHPDGKYVPFQQGAVIAENALTPASFGLNAAEMVEIEFVVNVPDNTIKEATLRLIGNTYSTGNLFTEFDGGSSVIPARGQLMRFDGDRSYSATLLLPAGADFRYKYTLGSGFTNAELSQTGDFYSRQYIVPGKDAKVTNTVHSWARNESEKPIILTISVPEHTPPNDHISIQFNPFVWMQPIPMWKTADYQWSYAIYGPFEYLDGAQFRVCRNDQCGYADDLLTAGKNGSGFVLNLEELGDNRQVAYQIENWVGLEASTYSVPRAEYAYQKPGAFKTISFPANYDPYWLPYLEWGMIDAAISGSNSISISPSWAISPTFPLQTERMFGKTFSTSEITEINSYAQDAGMSLILFPKPDFGNHSVAAYWSRGQLAYNWWLDWFEMYSRLVKNYAFMSEQLGLETLILGGSTISPALPNGRLPDGSPSNTPYDMSDRWAELVSDIKAIYSGKIIFALSEDLENLDAYTFLANVDGVLIEVDGALTSTSNPDLASLRASVAEKLDQSLARVFQIYNRPVILGLQYTSIDGSASNCVNLSKNCKDSINDSLPGGLPIDLNEQADIYSAFFSESLQRDWVHGIISMGYDPSVVVFGASASIRGKPAFDVLSYYNNQVILD